MKTPKSRKLEMQNTFHMSEMTEKEILQPTASAPSHWGLASLKKGTSFPPS